MSPRASRKNPFWKSLDQKLASVSMELAVEKDDFYSQEEWTVYRMHYTGLRGYRLFSWLSVPKDSGQGGLPAVVRMPDYGSVHDLIHTPLRQRAVVMNPTYRGQRGSDTPFQASYPGLLTEGIGSTETYIMAKVVGDALRSVDALTSQNIAPLGQVAVVGTGLGGALALAVAARRSVLRSVAADTPLALGHPGAFEAGSAYPLAELADYLRLYSGQTQAVVDAWSPLNLMEIAPEVNPPVLLSLGRNDRGLCPFAIGQELAGLLPQCDLRTYDGGSEGGGHEHNLAKEAWLKSHLGID